MVPVVKNFPKFDREYFGAPEKMFEGWNPDDFARLVCAEQGLTFSGWDDEEFTHKYSSIDSILFDGWLRGTSYEYGGEASWRLSIRKEASRNGFLLYPIYNNEVLFPYTIMVWENAVSFLARLNVYNYYSKNYFPFELVKKAIDNTKLPIDRALLLEAFTGYSQSSHVPKPILDLKSLGVDEQVEEFFELDVPFEVLDNFLCSLVTKSWTEPDAINRVCKHLRAYAHTVHHSGISD